MVVAGEAPLLDLQAEKDPFKPRTATNELREEFGERVTIVVIPDASHALIPEQPAAVVDRKSTRLNSSHLVISYAVFCLKKKTRNGASREPASGCKVVSRP